MTESRFQRARSRRSARRRSRRRRRAVSCTDRVKVGWWRRRRAVRLRGPFRGQNRGSRNAGRRRKRKQKTITVARRHGPISKARPRSSHTPRELARSGRARPAHRRTRGPHIRRGLEAVKEEKGERERLAQVRAWPKSQTHWTTGCENKAKRPASTERVKR